MRGGDQGLLAQDGGPAGELSVGGEDVRVGGVWELALLGQGVIGVNAAEVALERGLGGQVRVGHLEAHFWACSVKGNDP